MYKRPLAPAEASFTFDFEGVPVTAYPGDTVAAALLSNGILSLRETPVSGARRAPFCMMGVCFDCLVRIDGVADQQACLVPARPGLSVGFQRFSEKAGT